ncbi:glycosyltransferase family 28 carboxy-terminal domain protein, partial [Gregarina niphandrodes]
MRLLVTVGTTSFDLLVERIFQVIDSSRLAEHFGTILVQVGGARASIIPSYTVGLEEEVSAWPDQSNEVSELRTIMTAERPLDEQPLHLRRKPEIPLDTERLRSHTYWFRYSKHLPYLMQDSDVVMCHCGAGTLIDAISSKAVIWGVNNTELMDDHQRELGEELANIGRIFFIDGQLISNLEKFGKK